MWRNWACGGRSGRVTFAIEQRREGNAKLKPVDVFWLIREDWLPLGSHSCACGGRGCGSTLARCICKLPERCGEVNLSATRPTD